MQSYHVTKRRPASITACVSCRRQKLKCSRDSPSCVRCVRLNRVCHYPALSQRSKRFHTVADDSIHIFPHQRGPHHNTSDGAVRGRAYGHDDGSPTISNANPISWTAIPQMPSVGYENSIDEVGVKVSHEIGLLLIDIYFQRHYQSHLLLDKQSLVTKYLAGYVPSYLIKAIFALATIFLGTSDYTTIADEIRGEDASSSNWATFGETCAQQASRDALAGADMPCVERLQACQILAIYWFSKSQTTRTNIHTAIAQRTSCLLRDDQLQDDKGQSHASVSSPESDAGPTRIHCYWACWLTRCVSQLNAHFEGSCWDDVVGRALPNDSHDVEPADTSSPLVFIDRDGQVSHKTTSDEPITLGFSPSLILLHGLWWEVQDFIRKLQRRTIQSATVVSTLYLLDKKIQDSFSMMRGDLKYSAKSSLSPIPHKAYRAFCLSYLYYSCLCTLHSSVVPILSCIPWPSHFPPRVAQLSASEALRHADHMKSMASHLLSQKPEFSMLWPLIGHAASACAIIQIRATLAMRSNGRAHAEQVEVHHRIVSGLARFWMPLRPISSRIESMWAYAAATVVPTSSESMIGLDTSDSVNVPTDFTCLLIESLDKTSLPFKQDIYTYVANDDNEKVTDKNSTSLNDAQNKVDTSAPLSQGHPFKDSGGGSNSLTASLQHTHQNRNQFNQGQDLQLDWESLLWDTDIVSFMDMSFGHKR